MTSRSIWLPSLLYSRVQAAAAAAGATPGEWARTAIEQGLAREELLKAGTYAIPEPVYRPFAVECPRPGCGVRIRNRLFDHDMSYRVHYLDHVIEDLELLRRS